MPMFAFYSPSPRRDPCVWTGSSLWRPNKFRSMYSGTKTSESVGMSAGKRQQILDLEHYLNVLEHKPGALAGSKPLEQCRKMGRWPSSYDRFWEGLIRRQGKQQGTREMIAILKLDRLHGPVKLRQAIDRRWIWAVIILRQFSTFLLPIRCPDLFHRWSRSDCSIATSVRCP